MRKRIVVVDKEKCNPEACGGYLCIRVSPSNRAGKEAFKKGPDGKVMVDESLVSDVDKITVKKCPTGALRIVNLPEALNKEPIHRYGSNGFALFNLPIPVFGKVVGIIGKNGLGKSTALSIISKEIRPNLGKEEATEKEIINYFKGTEAHAFFEKLYKNEIKVAFKPQKIELIPKAFQGTVKELLERVNEKGNLNEIIKKTGLERFIDRKINQISGGELQKVAIAATVLKKANVYVFDEPTSYLDIKQRIMISKFIRNIADEKTSVLVVEHDLIILDAMTDLIHIMYGEEDVYGVVSQPKSTKTGINVYLEGYLKEENIRFRPTKIIFEPKSPVEEKEETELMKWERFSKKIGDFTLESEEGKLYRNDIVGVLGENGIGKTTFVKTIAEKEKNKVAYKPQYIEGDEKTVREALQECITKYNNQIIKPLNLDKLMDKKLNQLSGGQLQRVLVAQAIGREADLYLLDEPATYLDVEQRITLSKVIREIMELHGKAAIIVDHDILFIDYISKRLLVFEGTPAKHGVSKGPYTMEEGMNKFLKDLGVTFRRDEENHRPRVNKEGSVKDREQKEKGKLYYI